MHIADLLQQWEQPEFLGYITLQHLFHVPSYSNNLKHPRHPCHAMRRSSDHDQLRSFNGCLLVKSLRGILTCIVSIRWAHERINLGSHDCSVPFTEASHRTAIMNLIIDCRSKNDFSKNLLVSFQRFQGDPLFRHVPLFMLQMLNPSLPTTAIFGLCDYWAWVQMFCQANTC